MLKGKIAAIANESTVIINLGSQQGVKPGMMFSAIYETGPISDPDNPGEPLGDLVFRIAEMQATNVQEKMTICKILDPYIATFDLFPNLKISETKVDSRVQMIASAADLKLKVGTVVQEQPAKTGKELPAQREPAD